MSAFLFEIYPIQVLKLLVVFSSMTKQTAELIKLVVVETINIQIVVLAKSVNFKCHSSLGRQDDNHTSVQLNLTQLLKSL